MPAAERTKTTFIEDARRRQIVESAIAVIREHGYAETTLQRVATHAGISKGVISYHFAGKDDLMRQVIATVITDVTIAMTGQINFSEPGMVVLEQYVRANIGWFRQNLARGLAFKEVLINFKPKDEPPPTDIYDRDAVTALETLIARGQEDGSIRPGSPQIMALLIRRAIDAVLDLWSFHPESPIDRWTEELWSHISRAVRAEAA